MMQRAGPAESTNEGPQAILLCGQPCLISGSKAVHAPDEEIAFAFEPFESNPAAHGQRLLRRIQDLHDMAAHSLGCEPGEGMLDRLERSQEIAEQDYLRMPAERYSRRDAGDGRRIGGRGSSRQLFGDAIERGAASKWPGTRLQEADLLTRAQEQGCGRQ